MKGKGLKRAGEKELVDDKKVLSIWDAEKEQWYISIVDVIVILTGTDRGRMYWSDLKTKLKKEGSELSAKIGQLKMQSADGKFYLTDVADTELLFCFKQFIPLPKAELFKHWLVQVVSK
ncbi:MAG: hypothetical protein ACOVNZ_09215 [Crocinitomicaceae bacterium]